MWLLTTKAIHVASVLIHLDPIELRLLQLYSIIERSRNYRHRLSPHLLAEKNHMYHEIKVCGTASLDGCEQRSGKVILRSA